MDIPISGKGFDLKPGQTAVLGIRPPDLLPVDAGHGSLNGVADLIEFHGNDALVTFRFAGKEIGALVKTSSCPKTGDRVTFGFDEARIHLFDAETGLSLRAGM